MKEISLLNMSPREKQYVLQEIEIMRGLKHPHIIDFHSFEVGKEKVSIYMEYAENGTLADVLRNNSSISEDRVLLWAK